LAVAIGAAFCSVLIYGGAQLFYQRSTSATPQGLFDNPLSAESKSPEEAKEVLRQTADSFRQVAKSVGPAVVSINATRGAPKRPMGPRMRRRGGPPMGPEGEEGFPPDPFFEFFERFGLPFPAPEQQGPQMSSGSGILIDPKGIVVTNNHVIDGATEISISLVGDRSKYKAKVVGTDPRTDLAVLRVEGKSSFPSVQWADSDKVEVGDWAVAIGSPFGLGQSLTVGVVSAKGDRNSPMTQGVGYGGELIQTDAAINPGNSGGPLCTLDGKVMGVNTAIYTRSGGYMGIGFAIPSSLAREVVEKLVTDGKIVRGWLGVLIQSLDPAMAKDLGITDGVVIYEVIEKSPAAAAGIRGGDVVLEVDGKAVKDTGSLQRIVGGYKPGQTVKVKIVRYEDKKHMTFSVKVGKLPEESELAAKGGGPGGGATEESNDIAKVGLTVAKGPEGIVVQSVQPGSPAQQSGIDPGDVIVRVNRKAPSSVADLKKIVDGSKLLFVEIRRRGQSLFRQVPVPE
jgi:serine protease Do